MSFASDVRRIAEKMQIRTEVVARNTIIELFSSVIRDTPVDTGRLRGNWQTTAARPADGQLDRKDQTGHTAVSDVVNNVTREPGKFYLTNNLPYAQVAEYGLWGTGPGKTDKTTSKGFSAKAPAGMVRKNVKRIRQILRRKAAEL